MADNDRNGMVTWPHLTKELARVYSRVDNQYAAMNGKLDTIHEDLGEVKDRLVRLETSGKQKEKSTGRALAYVTLLIAVVAILFAGIRTFS